MLSMKKLLTNILNGKNFIRTQAFTLDKTPLGSNEYKAATGTITVPDGYRPIGLSRVRSMSAAVAIGGWDVSGTTVTVYGRNLTTSTLPNWAPVVTVVYMRAS